VLGHRGKSFYRQVEVTARVRRLKDQEMVFPYVRRRTRGNLNEFSRYLGDFPSYIIPRDLFSQRPEDLPNRFLAWGVFALPWKLRVYPIVEYRTGSPYAVVDATRNYVGFLTATAIGIRTSSRRTRGFPRILLSGTSTR
jgi:hypothetical protein